MRSSSTPKPISHTAMTISATACSRWRWGSQRHAGAATRPPTTTTSSAVMKCGWAASQPASSGSVAIIFAAVQPSTPAPSQMITG